MQVFLWVIIYYLILVISKNICLTTSPRTSRINVLIGASILFVVLFYSRKIFNNNAVIAISLGGACLYNSLFYNNYKFSFCTIEIFAKYIAYICLVNGGVSILNSFFPEERVVITCFMLCAVIFLLELYQMLAGKRKSEVFKIKKLVMCSIVAYGKSVVLKMYFDSGNMVKYKNLPVVFVNASKLPFLNAPAGKVSVKTILNSNTEVDVYLIENFYILKNKNLEKHCVAVVLVENEFAGFDGLLNVNFM